MPNSRQCPSCLAPMDKLSLSSVNGGEILLDLCFPCQGMWFDPQENLKLAPASVVELFRILHARQNETRQALAPRMACPHCKHALVQGFDVVKSGRYITYRCPQRHGRFSTFSSFMIEKGFVRQLTPAEIDDMARRVAVIHCTSCGAPVDLRKDHACPHCRSAFSLLDPKAVEKALAGYAKAVNDKDGAAKAPDLADALIMLERNRAQAQRSAKERGYPSPSVDTSPNIDLWGIGLAMVRDLLD